MARRSGALTTFGVLNFIVGGFMLLCAVCSGVDLTVTINNRDVTQEMKAFLNQEVPGYSVVKIGGAITGMVLAVGLVVSGIGLLKVHNWGRILAILCCFGAVLHHAGMAVYQLFFVNPALDRFFGPFGPINFSILPKILALAGMGGYIIAGIFYLLEIVILAIDKSFSQSAEDYEDGPDDDDRRRPRRRAEVDDDDDDRPRRRRSRLDDDDMDSGRDTRR